MQITLAGTSGSAGLADGRGYFSGMTHADLSRRSVAKGAAWAVPAMTVASAAPTMAASCDPATTVVAAASTVRFSTTGSLVDDPSNVSVTYVNDGPDALVAGTILTVVLDGSYPEGGETPTAAPTAMPSSTTFGVSGQSDTSQNVSAYRLVVKATLGQSLAPGQSLAIAMNTAGFAPVSSSSTTDTDYGGGETSSISNVTDSTNSSQDIVEACRTISETITVVS